MSMNVSALSASAGYAIDSEYQRILRELRALGIEPTGNKATDKAKLEEAKATKQTQEVQNTQPVNETQGTEKTRAESSQDNIKNDSTIQAQQMTGATQIAEFNKYKLLGLY